MARRRNANRRHHRGSSGFLVKVLSVLVIVLAILIALTLFFKVEHIEISGTRRYTDEEVLDAAGVGIGDNLFLLNKYRMAQNIRIMLPYIESIRINRRLPDTLVIELGESADVAAFVQDGYVWVVTPSGKIVEQHEVSDLRQLPKCTIVDGAELLAPSVGTQLALATEFGLQYRSLLDLMAALEEADMLKDTDAIHLGDVSILSIDYMGRFTVQFNYGADYHRKMRSLEAILAKEENGVKVIQENMTGTFDMRRDDGKTNFIQTTPK